MDFFFFGIQITVMHVTPVGLMTIPSDEGLEEVQFPLTVGVWNSVTALESSLVIS